MTYPDNLPKQTENKVGLSFGEIKSVNVDNVAADSLGRRLCQRQVFVFRVEGQVLLVDSSFVNRVRNRVIDNLAVNKNNVIVNLIFKGSHSYIISLVI